MTKVSEIIDRFEQFAPLTFKEPGDPTGFQLGDREAVVHQMMTTLDVRPEVVQEAIDRNVDFIFAHHPVMFRPAANLDLANPQNAMYAELLKHNITVYAAHTNLDNAPGGMNDWLAAALGLEQTTGLVEHEQQDDEPELAMGRVGILPQPMTLTELATRCKERFNLRGIRVVSFAPKQVVQRVAILGGSGGKFYPAALAQHADVYITGDLFYHTAQDLLATGLTALDPGHHIESICKPRLRALFNQWKTEAHWEITVLESELNTDPFQFQ
ncbi:Nif3-like dinuclear metal center hexameric protein [Fructilactobacillus myrtifloralis]|uniref:GTP cyclohydrolase 1 type 2 homolog n=1 Tax=Fructilactobacillus myrtifloralis TaxID=2940301 RepID=A0ABY5BQR7_9LACO|nr:Nif3-like dinuclear metal center hexameric protein [Fructilactobacillus myrtifloralis]USS85387.1 Nif3-like dinuclear metal center hexameric protein [Fructilactobacillus myrtifloralis]